MSSDRKRILVLTPQLPYPPHQGTTIRNYNLIQELATQHDIHLLSFAATPDHGDSVAHLRSFCRDVQVVAAPVRATRDRVVSTFTSMLPDMALRLESAAFHVRLDAMLSEHRFHIAQIEGIEMAPYLLQLASAPGPRPLLVFDDHNAEYVLQRRAFETDLRKPSRWPAAAYSLIQWQKLARYERIACQASDRIVAVSPADAEALRRLLPAIRVDVVPNGVDLEYWRPESTFSPLPKSPSLVFVGKMDFRPNVDAVLWFHNDVLPLIRREMPEAHFFLVGKHPHERLAPLAQSPHVSVTGYVPDARPYVAGAAVYIVPLRIGGGTRLKVLEAMAMGKAIVSTTLGCEGIGLSHGQEALLADTPREFADAVISLLRDAERGEALGQRAHESVAARYGWKRIVPMLERAYDSA